MSINTKYIALIIIGCVFFISIILGGGIKSAIDFSPFYYSSQILSEGGNIYDFNLLKETIITNGHDNTAIHYLYPPFLSILLQPLNKLSLISALIIWLAINTTALIICLGWLLKTFFYNKTKYFLVVLASLLIYFPIILNLQLGQINPIILLLISGGLILLLNKKNTRAGILLGIASLLKVFPIIFLIYALFIKKWKTALSGIITILFGIILTSLLARTTGFFSYVEYIKFVLPSIFSGSLPGWSPGNLSLWFLDTLWTTTKFTTLISIFTKSLLGLFFIFITYKYLIKKMVVKKDSILFEFSFLVTLMIIFSAFSFHHYLIWLIIPFVILLKKYLENNNKYLLIGIILSFILAAIPPFLVSYFLPININDTIYPFVNPGFWSIIIILTLIVTQYFSRNKK